MPLMTGLSSLVAPQRMPSGQKRRCKVVVRKENLTNRIRSGRVHRPESHQATLANAASLQLLNARRPLFKTINGKLGDSPLQTTTHSSLLRSWLIHERAMQTRHGRTATRDVERASDLDDDATRAAVGRSIHLGKSSSCSSGFGVRVEGWSS